MVEALPRAAVLAVIALWLGACDKPQPKTAPAQPRPQALSAAERFMPLPDATVYAYDTQSGASSERGLLVLEVRRRRPGLAELVVAGNTSRVELDATGLRHATGGWLLKEPLALGAKWQGNFGQVEVTAVDRNPSVPAGNYTGCLETVESVSSAEFSKRTTTVFCPDVGIATRVTEVEADAGFAAETMKLKSFGPRFSLE